LAASTHPGYKRGVPAPAKPFYVADLNARGELHAQQDYSYQELERIPAAADLIAQFSTAIWREPEEFVTQVGWSGGLKMRWRASAKTAGIATLRAGEELASLSLLCCGVDADADRITLAAFQRHLLTELHDTGYEPGFDLIELKARPLVATINFRSPDDAREQMVAALADRCFGASYFRFQGMV